jgi:hypothetical protein
MRLRATACRNVRDKETVCFAHGKLLSNFAFCASKTDKPLQLWRKMKSFAIETAATRLGIPSAI